MLEAPGSDSKPERDHAHLRLELERAELENARLRDQLRSRDQRFSLLKRALDGVRAAVWLIASWIPLTALQPIASSFAGQDTNFEAGLTVTFAFSIVVSSALIAALFQSHLRKKKVQTQRTRLDHLEAQLLQQQRQIAALERLPDQREGLT